MPVSRPDNDALRAIAEGRGLGLTAAEIKGYAPVVDQVLNSFDRVDALHRAHAGDGSAHPRVWRSPAPEENPLGAWQVRAEIRGAGSGPLAGKTVAIKDNTQVAGLPMVNGSRTLEGFVSTTDATIVTRLLAAGATIAGKAVCEDLCISGGSHTAASGHVRNPWDPTRSAGGSSSGSAVLLALGEVDLATGGDQGGSIRMPAAYTGVVGLKPTYGLVPYTGVFPIERTLDHVGPMARTVGDAALMLAVIAGPDGLDPRQPGALPSHDYVAEIARPVGGMRVGVLAEGFAIPGVSDPAVSAAVHDAVTDLHNLGVVTEKVSVPEHLDAIHLWNVLAVEGVSSQMIDQNGYGMNAAGHYDPELIEFFGRRWRAAPEMFSMTVKTVLLAAQHTSRFGFGSYYAKARNLSLQLRRAYDDLLSDYDALVMPTVPITASVLPAPDASPTEIFTRAFEHLGNTAPFDITGHPAISVPCDQVRGLPTGLMIVGRHFDDAGVLRLAHAFERSRGGFPMPPCSQQAPASPGTVSST